MNESENKFETSAPAGEDLRAEVQSLRSMLSFTLLLAFVFSFFVFVYLRSQNSQLNAQLANQESALNAAQPMAAELLGKLSDYAKTHPDYQPIFQKYSHLVKVSTNGTGK
jgi:hypothetical protein